MKTHNGYGFLDVPLDGYDFRVINPRPVNTPSIDFNIKGSGQFSSIKLPPGQWSILGLAKDLGEQDWKGIVEKSDEFPGITLTMYKIYNNPPGTVQATAKAKTSGDTLLKSLGLKDNVLILKQV